SRGLVMDSGGPGKQRGGIGRQMIIRSPDDPEMAPGRTTIAVQAGRFVYPPQGIFKGKDGAKALFLKNSETANPSGLTFCDAGNTISFISAGGGGYGDPLERDPKAVEQDVQYGYVSIERAKLDYGVIIDPDSLTLDLSSTLQLRENK
ncbi:MAG: hydantoinase B/oxoprolinase family protein, partial [Deltaproteobacteria bacterium]